MDDWTYFFGAICSIRFHPKNHQKDTAWEIRYAADIATQMVAEKEKRYASMDSGSSSSR